VPARPESMLRSLKTPHARDMRRATRGETPTTSTAGFKPSNDSSVSADGADHGGPKPLLSALLESR
jgi:hypothetical protein